MAQRVTLQNIADELGLSRNTVSKAINNTGVLSDSTRERVLRKAQEMGYKQFSYMEFKGDASGALSGAGGQELTKNEVAVLLEGLVGGSHFAYPMLECMQKELSDLGYNMSMYRIMPEEIDALQLPGALNLQNTAAILCVELFSTPYCRMLASLKVPFLMIDGPVVAVDGSVNADQLLMDNQRNMFAFVGEMKRRGKTRIGFVGDFLHCQSFYEKYSAFRQALELNGMKEEGTITAPLRKMDGKDYHSVLEHSLSSLKELPDVYICANDFVAIDTLKVLNGLNIQVPDDIWLCGFDDAPEAGIVSPQLTTVRIHGKQMGRLAVNILMARLQTPDACARTVYTATDLVYRRSTGD